VDIKQKVDNYLTKEKFRKYMLLNTSTGRIVCQADSMEELTVKGSIYHLSGGTPHMIVERKGFTVVQKSGKFVKE
jgi:hypothetical protein